HHGLRLIVYRPDLGEPGDLVVDVEEAGDAPGRRGVHHHVVVDEPPAAVLAPHRLARLAGQQDVPHAGRDGGGEVDRPEFLQGSAGAAHLVEHLEVVQKGAFRIDGEGVHLPAPGCDGDLPLLVRQRVRLEELCDALAALDLDEKRPLPLRGQGQREGRGHRGLAGTALAADDLEPAHAFEPNCCPRAPAAPGDSCTTPPPPCRRPAVLARALPAVVTRGVAGAFPGRRPPRPRAGRQGLSRVRVRARVVRGWHASPPPGGRPLPSRGGEGGRGRG